MRELDREPDEAATPRTSDDLPSAQNEATAAAIDNVVQAAVVHGGVHMHRTGASRPAGPQDDAAEQLAGAVRAQWVREIELRRAYDPQPLEVHWRVVDSDLTDHRDNIERKTDGTRLDLGDLGGYFADVTDVYRMVPSERLLVLGAPGSGKTVLAIHFVLSTIDNRRSTTDRVPVLFNLGSWNPTVAFRDWLVDQLVRDYPMSTKLAADLIGGDRILPVLDGFDEIAEGFHQVALHELSATTIPLLLTSRAGEFRQAVVSTGRRLSRAAVVELDKLGMDDLAGYLPLTTRRTTVVDTTNVPMWTHLLDEVHNDSDSPASTNFVEALSTPLMAALARAVYSDDPRRHPDELLDTERFPTAQSIEEHLLASFVPAVYSSTGRDPEKVEKVERWFGFLAWHLDRRHTFDLAWWRLAEAVPQPTRSLVMGAFAALTTGLPIVLFFHLFSLSMKSGTLLGAIVSVAVLLATWIGRNLLAGLLFAVPAGASLGALAVMKGLPGDIAAGGAVLTSIMSISLYWMTGLSSPAPSRLSFNRRRRTPVGRRRIIFGFWGGTSGAAFAAYAGVTGLTYYWEPAVSIFTGFIGIFVGILMESTGARVRFNARGATLSIIASTALWLLTYIWVVPYTGNRVVGFLLGVPICATAGLFFSAIPTKERVAPNTDTPLTPPQRMQSASFVYLPVIFSAIGLLIATVEILEGSPGAPGHGRGALVLLYWLTGIGVGTLTAITLTTFTATIRTIAGFEHDIDLRTASSPLSVLRSDRNNAFVGALVYAAPLSALSAVLLFYADKSTAGVVSTAILVALVVAVLVGVVAKAWGRWLVLGRFWLPLTGRLPWRLTSFLVEAHQLGLLRQVGAVYQFRHARLQAYLAHNYLIDTESRLEQ